MKTNYFKTCILAAAMSLFYACSPDEQVVADLDKISKSENAMRCDVITFDNAVTRNAAGFVTSVQSEGGVVVGVSGIQRFYPPNSFFPLNPGVYSPDNRANLYNTNIAPVSVVDPTIPGGMRVSDDTDLSAASQTGNALIINQNNRADVPDDWAWGGSLHFDFSSMGTVTLNSLLWLDNESRGSHIILYGAGGVVLKTIPVPSTADAAADIIDLQNTAGVVRMEVVLGSGIIGSGAIDNINFCYDVPETGCTRTQGYWKNHAPGSKKADPAWGNLATTQFFRSGETYLSIFDVQPRGNAYYILAHQYVAATLNLASGATMPASVLAAYNSATTFFQTYGPGQTAVSKNQLTQWAGILDAYNNGVTGPGHCDD